MNLDMKKVERLCSIVRENKYGYSDSENELFKIDAALSQMKICVTVINGITMKNERVGYALEFIVLVNYIDLLIAAIDKISKSFNFSIKYGNIFCKYHDTIKEKNDKDFFRFIRAIVLPHALSLDNKAQKVFTNGKTAYCPYVVWETNNRIRIVYYNNDLRNYLHSHTICVDDIELFVMGIYNQLDELCCVIKKIKESKKAAVKKKLNNENYSSCNSILEKCLFLLDLTKKYGDIDDKTEVSYNMHLLLRCRKLCNTKFTNDNKLLYEKYLRAVEIALDDYYRYMCDQRDEEKLLDLVLSPQFSYSSYTSFFNLGYPISKIVTEMENIDDFSEFFDELKPIISQRATFEKSMSVEQLCIVVLMVQFFDKLEKDPSYKELKERLYSG